MMNDYLWLSLKVTPFIWSSLDVILSGFYFKTLRITARAIWKGSAMSIILPDTRTFPDLSPSLPIYFWN